MRLLTVIILTTASFLSIAQQKIINCFSSDYITPPMNLYWEINNIYVSNGLYKIEVNNDIFPKYLFYYDTLHIPVWIPEKELLTEQDEDLTYQFIITEKRQKSKK